MMPASSALAAVVCNEEQTRRRAGSEAEPHPDTGSSSPSDHLVKSPAMETTHGLVLGRFNPPQHEAT